MQYNQFRNALKDFTIFSINNIKMVDPHFYRRRLNEWQTKGYIKKIIKGYYIFSDLTLNENVLFEIANKIYSPSYISFEMALSYYHLIPESVYAITSASTRRTYNFITSIAEFNYRTIKPGLYFGYEIIRYNGKSFKITSLEKAILDYFYINPHLKTEDDFASLRINTDVFFQKIKRRKLSAFCQKFSQKTLTNRINSFLEFLSSESKE